MYKCRIMRSFAIYFDLSIGTGRRGAGGGGGMKHRRHHQCGRDHAIMLIAWTMDNRLSSLSAGLF
jgi:hypothetical protein